MTQSTPFTRRLRHEFSPSDRERGERYWRERRVAIEVAGGEAVHAVVRGQGGRYRVSLRRVEDEAAEPFVEGSCSCPRFEQTIACKHLWALLVELDSNPRGFSIPGEEPLDLMPELDDDEDEADSDEAGVLEVQRAARSHPGGQPLRGGAISGRTRAGGSPHGAPDALAWLEGVGSPAPAHSASGSREIYYVIEPEAITSSGWIELRLLQRERNRAGELGRLKTLSIRSSEVDGLPEPDASALAALLPCAASHSPYFSTWYPAGSAAHDFTIAPGLQPLLLPLLARTGRLCAPPLPVNPGAPPAEALVPLRWEGDSPYALHLRLEPSANGEGWRLLGELQGPEPFRPDELRGIAAGGLAILRDRIVRVAPLGLEGLLTGLREHGPIEVPRSRLPALMERIAALPLPPIEMPEALGWREETGAPTPRLAIAKPRPSTPSTLFWANVGFAYGTTLFGLDDARVGAAESEARRIVRRDLAREALHLAELRELGCTPLAAYSRGQADVQLSRRRMPELARELLARGWSVEAEGVRIRRPGAAQLRVTTGIDWFDLEGAVDFEGESVAFPALLAALERGDSTVALSDGSLGVLPEDWLARVAPLAELGQRENGAIRFLPSQAMLLDALLAAQPGVEVDEAFRRTCERLEAAGRPTPAEAPPEFRGELRGYQREGLGWLRYVGELGVGGCLADDMGLGKTVQVLALLASRRRTAAAAGEPRPSLVVVPKSLVHNWLAEAARFTPELRMLDYTGLDRERLRDGFADFDAIVTTYGTLRRDIHKLAELRFDTVVLDEAQAIKNAGAQTSKAARLLRAEHRLALSGTPIENHLGELWALFDFLNPGMLGASARRARTLDEAGEAAVSALAGALRPFLLRRTKQEVLRELPAKTEQTLFCTLEGGQKRLYDELRRHYQASLLRRVDAQGMARSRIQVLEALLRLRQAACHPGLVDRKRVGEASAKLEVLFARLDEALAEGHKALVFSQFTSLLAIVRARLEERGVTYAYLDGRTRHRAEAVERFQEDPACPVFLVSLKAGGQGLNLTAADYVFLLDPWWNPAVETQAVDRAHRIGQERPVFAYRIVAEGTIEEKILALQERKRRLADAIVSASSGLARQLTREDLEFLLG